MASFLKSDSGKPTLLVDEDGFIYEFHTENKERNYWKCEKAKYVGCKARVVTITADGNPIIVGHQKKNCHTGHVAPTSFVALSDEEDGDDEAALTAGKADEAALAAGKAAVSAAKVSTTTRSSNETDDDDDDDARKGEPISAAEVSTSGATGRTRSRSRLSSSPANAPTTTFYEDESGAGAAAGVSVDEPAYRSDGAADVSGGCDSAVAPVTGREATPPPGQVDSGAAAATSPTAVKIARSPKSFANEFERFQQHIEEAASRRKLSSGGGNLSPSYVGQHFLTSALPEEQQPTETPDVKVKTSPSRRRSDVKPCSISLTPLKGYDAAAAADTASVATRTGNKMQRLLRDDDDDDATVEDDVSEDEAWTPNKTATAVKQRAARNSRVACTVCKKRLKSQAGLIRHVQLKADCLKGYGSDLQLIRNQVSANQGASAMPIGFDDDRSLAAARQLRRRAPTMIALQPSSVSAATPAGLAYVPCKICQGKLRDRPSLLRHLTSKVRCRQGYGAEFELLMRGEAAEADGQPEEASPLVPLPTPCGAARAEPVAAKRPVGRPASASAAAADRKPWLGDDEIGTKNDGGGGGYDLQIVDFVSSNDPSSLTGGGAPRMIPNMSTFGALSSAGKRPAKPTALLSSGSKPIGVEQLHKNSAAMSAATMTYKRTRNASFGSLLLSDEVDATACHEDKAFLAYVSCQLGKLSSGGKRVVCSRIMTMVHNAVEAEEKQQRSSQY